LHKIANEQNLTPVTNALTNKFQVLVAGLFKIVDRDDAPKHLIINAFNAMYALICTAKLKTFEFLDKKAIPELLSRLERATSTNHDSEPQYLLCSIWQSATYKFPSERIRI
jgi:hypothetical protein